MTQWILAPDGHPFRDRDAAQIKRDLLMSDLGAAVTLEVISHPKGGFAVSVQRPGSMIGPRGDDSDSPRDLALRAVEPGQGSQPTPVTKSQLSTVRESPRATDSVHARTSASNSYPEVFRLSPAVRAFLGLHLQAILGAFLLLQPHLVFVVTGVGIPTNSTAGAILLVLIAASGALLAGISVSRFLWSYTANTYVVDGSGIEQVQWYFDKGRLRRRSPRVNFAHLRSADVDQTLMQMLINVGSLKLAAGSTDSYEVVLRHIAAPRALQREFQRRLHQAHASLRPEASGGF